MMTARQRCYSLVTPETPSPVSIDIEQWCAACIWKWHTHLIKKGILFIPSCEAAIKMRTGPKLYCTNRDVLRFERWCPSPLHALYRFLADTFRDTSKYVGWMLVCISPVDAGICALLASRSGPSSLIHGILFCPIRCRRTACLLYQGSLC